MFSGTWIVQMLQSGVRLQGFIANYFYRPHTKYDGRYCFHRRVSFILSTGPPGDG